jgi:hypothetical protein
VSAVLDWVPVDRITAEARETHPGRALLTLVAAVLFGMGWLAAKAVGVVWLVLAWSFAAVKVGWQDARAAGQAGARGRAAG